MVIFLAGLRQIPGMYYEAASVEDIATRAATATDTAADTLLLTVPNQLGVDYNAHILESVLTDVAPDLGWR